MAKASKGSGGGGGASKGGGGGIVALILLTLIGAGLGVGYKLYVLEKPPEPQVAQEDSEKKSEHPDGKNGHGGDHDADKEGDAKISDGNTIVRLEPIVTDMQGEPKRWLRVEVSLVFSSKPEEGLDVVAKQANGDILAFLRTVSLAQIEGPDGLEYLTDDLEDLARTRSRGAVSRLLINSLVTE